MQFGGRAFREDRGLSTATASTEFVPKFFTRFLLLIKGARIKEKLDVTEWVSK